MFLISLTLVACTPVRYLYGGESKIAEGEEHRFVSVTKMGREILVSMLSSVENTLVDNGWGIYDNLELIYIDCYTVQHSKYRICVRTSTDL